jgi:hypothetical protein
MADEDYYGRINLWNTWKTFFPIHREEELPTEDAHKIIDVITNIREKPSQWPIDKEENTKQ